MGRTAADAAPRRIVVGVAASAASVAAVTWAAREAVLRGAVLHAVHAWEPAARGRAPYAPGLRGVAHDGERQAAEALLATVVQEGLAGAGLADARLDSVGPLLEVAEGLPVQVLLHCAAGAELLVLGGAPAAEDAAGRPSPSHVGPVARACLRAAPCPVVTVAPQHVAAPRRVPEPGPGAVRKLAGVS
jgi:nucleotide-binding universal stress UspA family protein